MQLYINAQKLISMLMSQKTACYNNDYIPFAHTSSNKPISKCYWLILALISLPVLCSAQIATIKGTVVSQGEPVIGATVSIRGTTIGVTTDLNGEFTLKEVPVGEQTMVFSFVGFQTKEIEVTVTAGLLYLEDDIEIEEGLNLKEFIVEDKMRDGNEKAVKMQKETINLVQIVASENIESLPDRNAAEALQRMPGMVMETDQGEGSYVSFRGTPTDWGAALINGDRMPVADEDDIGRAFNFEVMPTTLIEYIVFNQSMAAELEGDAIGGSANFITKFVPENPEFEVELGMGQNFKAREPLFDVSLSGGRRFGKNKNFGAVGGVSVYNRNYATDNYELFYSNNDNHNIERLELRKYNGERTSYGAHTKFDYRINKNNELYVLGFYGRLDDQEFHRKTMYNWVSGVGQTIILHNIHSRRTNEFNGLNAGGNHKISDKVSFDWKVARYETEFRYGPSGPENEGSNAGYNVIEYEKLVHFDDYLYLDEEGNRTDERSAFERWRLLDIDSPIPGYGDPAHNLNPRYSNVTPIKPEDTMFLHKKTFAEIRNSYEQDPIVVGANVHVEINKKMNLRIGGKHRQKKGYRKYEFESWVRDPQKTGDALLYIDNDLYDIPNSERYLREEDGNYQQHMEQFLSDDGMQNWIKNNSENLIYLPFTPTTTDLYKQFVGGNFEYEESVNAGYIALDWEISKKFKLDFGVRVEETDIEIIADNAQDTVYFDMSTGDVIIETWIEKDVMTDKYLSVLPMINFNYSINQKSSLRGAFTRSFRRPNFSELKPGFPDIHYTHFHALYGNPDLRPTFSWNGDVSYQRYIGLKGVLTVSAYYKYVIDHIYTAFKSEDALNVSGISNTFRPPGGILSKEFQNAPYAHVGGIELTMVQKLHFLPGFLKNLSVRGNYAFTESKMRIESRDELQPLPRQARHIANFRLSYDVEKFSASIATNYRAPFLMELNLIAVRDPETGEPSVFNQTNDFDMFMGVSWGLDASAQYHITPKLSVYAEVNNLLNTPFVIYRGVRERPFQVEYYGLRALAGLKYNFTKS